MKRVLAGLALAAFVASPAFAALPVGAKAPEFKTTVALAGKDANFDLTDTLKKGPVVLYFFPAAFTPGCTAEAHEFAEATADFNKLGATVIGMTAGNTDRIREFSTVECRDKFAVGAAQADVIKAYDVAAATRPGMTDRVSYVIAPDGKVLLVHSDANPAQHVTLAMDAVKAWKAGKK